MYGKGGRLQARATKNMALTERGFLNSRQLRDKDTSPGLAYWLASGKGAQEWFRNVKVGMEGGRHKVFGTGKSLIKNSDLIGPALSGGPKEATGVGRYAVFLPPNNIECPVKRNDAVQVTCRK
jgi:hypothetical protein